VQIRKEEKKEGGEKLLLPRTPSISISRQQASCGCQNAHSLAFAHWHTTAFCNLLFGEHLLYFLLSFRSTRTAFQPKIKPKISPPHPEPARAAQRRSLRGAQLIPSAAARAPLLCALFPRWRCLSLQMVRKTEALSSPRWKWIPSCLHFAAGKLGRAPVPTLAGCGERGSQTHRAERGAGTSTPGRGRASKRASPLRKTKQRPNSKTGRGLRDAEWPPRAPRGSQRPREEQGLGMGPRSRSPGAVSPNSASRTSVTLQIKAKVYFTAAPYGQDRRGFGVPGAREDEQGPTKRQRHPKSPGMGKTRDEAALRPAGQTNPQRSHRPAPPSGTHRLGRRPCQVPPHRHRRSNRLGSCLSV